MKKRIDNSTQNDNLIPSDDYEYEKELAKQETEKQRLAQQRLEEQQAELERKKCEEQRRRERQIAQDKLDLMKMKAGVADESEEIKEVHEEKRVLTGKEKISNFWYHEKMWICFAIFIVAVVGFMVFDTVTREKADITIIMICDNALSGDTTLELLEERIERYTPDLNGDGEIHVQIMDCALNEYSTDSYYTTNSQKFYANLQQGSIIMVLTDSNTDPDHQALMVDGLEEVLPDNPYIDEYGLSLNMQFLADEIQCENMPNDIHLCLRRPVSTLDDSLEDMQENYDINLEIFIDLANALAQEAQECGDEGLSTEPSPLYGSESATDSEETSEVDSKAEDFVSE